MKLTQKQLRKLIESTLAEAPRRRKGGARASLGFSIPEESPDYGREPGVHASGVSPFGGYDDQDRGDDAFRQALEDVGCEVVGSSSDGTFHFKFPGLPAIATVKLKLFEF